MLNCPPVGARLWHTNTLTHPHSHNICSLSNKTKHFTLKHGYFSFQFSYFKSNFHTKQVFTDQINPIWWFSLSTTHRNRLRYWEAHKTITFYYIIFRFFCLFFSSLAISLEHTIFKLYCPLVWGPIQKINRATVMPNWCRLPSVRPTRLIVLSHWKGLESPACECASYPDIHNLRIRHSESALRNIGWAGVCKELRIRSPALPFEGGDPRESHWILHGEWT